MSTNKDTGHHSEYVPLEDQKIINVEINKEMRKSFLDYSMSVIVSRALPDVRDGLKPVHRRILYTMYENGLYPEKAYRKCADTVGSVLGRYHPHGDASVYDAMVRLAQDFSMRYPLVDGHGNFGSVDGDPPAAYRYTESRMSKISMEMLTNLDKDTVDMMRNYDDRLNEPVVLPSRFPNLLVNGSTGIAVGMATNIPPHNMREVIDGICCLIDNPDATLEDIMEHIKGPDFPTAGIIMGRAGIRAAYATGRGKVTLRARAEIVENEKNGRFKIVVTELPYQVNKARLIESIAELVPISKKFTILLDYAHNEVSTESLLTTLRAYKPHRLVVVFGCGGNRSKLRRYGMGEICAKMADFSILTEDNNRFEKVEDIIADIREGMNKGNPDAKFVEIPDRLDALHYAVDHAQEGDLIAVIGKGHETYRDREGVKTPFLERELLEEYAQQIGLE